MAIQQSLEQQIKEAHGRIHQIIGLSAPPSHAADATPATLIPATPSKPAPAPATVPVPPVKPFAPAGLKTKGSVLRKEIHDNDEDHSEA